jgi:murein DD-endopeptidase MepM/ murein hydrolase activator NlpD
LAKRSYTLIVVPDTDAPVKRFRVSRSLLLQLASVSLFGAGLAVAASSHYFLVARDAAENRVLREENLSLRGQLKSIRERVEHIGSTLDRVGRHDQKLRELSTLSGEPKGMAGPPETAPQSLLPARGGPPAPLSSFPAESQVARLDKLSAEALRQEKGLQEVTAYFEDQRSLLASVPSVWPARGWVTSDFGQRLDPYTADRVMHTGLDIAAEQGRAVYSSSDGAVVYAGAEGAYGNVVVVDHGFGVNTRYAHLGEMLVKAGDRVKRGQQLGSVGNTGRATGPHVHYEVRVNGIPQNPRKFILED